MAGVEFLICDANNAIFHPSPWRSPLLPFLFTALGGRKKLSHLILFFRAYERVRCACGFTKEEGEKIEGRGEKRGTSDPVPYCE